MSSEGLAWAFQRAPGVKKHLVSTLLLLANLADERGRGAHPTQEVLAWCTRKTDRAVRDDLTALEEAGLIRRGDQRMVAHLPPDRRPVVWDLAMELDRGPRPEEAPSGLARPGRTAAEADRGEADFRPVPGPGGSVLPAGPDRAEAYFRPVGQPGGSVLPAGPAPGGSRLPPGSRDETGQSTYRPEVGFRQDLGGGGENFSPPTPQPKGGSSAVNPAELTADEEALVNELSALRPDWSPVRVRDVLVSPEIRERTDRALVRRAFLMAAADRRTTSPKRLLHDACPAWSKALAELYPPPSADREPGVVVRLGRVAWCGADDCDKTTRTRIYPATGQPVIPQQRCPSCHPQSPARLP